ncbi:bidirectional sugar transporter SWEET4-like isoform X2 [Actinidia eriantha]|uniref:bidirectional sugar transporter SWEET4-like isoform X2 n=1 Tax=Actinidia eriantha TaxID=165200 RepID=UPI002588C587|nr:bidirectional sugar transporter SWEET4-like isoform X2 [Actinidia eriantha]
MFSRDTARTAVGVLGNIISFILFMSPVPTFVQIFKKGSVEQYSAAPYLGTLINCGLWMLYGLPMVHPHSFLVITINASGMVVELAYLLLFLRYSDRRAKVQVLVLMLVELVVIVGVAFLALTLAHTTKLRSTIVGSVAMLGNVIMYAAPLSVMAPNGLGTLFGLVQLILYATFYKSTERQRMERQGKGEMGLVENPKV